MRSLRRTLSLISVALLLGVPGAIQAQPGQPEPCEGQPFGCRVERAIERGLQHLQRQEGGGGVLLQPGDASHNSLALLPFFQVLEGGYDYPRGGRQRGYDGSARPVQLMMQRLVREALNRDQVASNPNSVPEVFVSGVNLMAWSHHLATGGPDEVGAAVTVSQGIGHTLIALQRHQGVMLEGNDGGWNYREPQVSGDLSTTLFAVLGLTHASNIIEGAAAPLVRVPTFLEMTRSVDGGHTYRGAALGGVGPSHLAMTAAGVLAYRRSEVPPGDPRMQRSLQTLLRQWAPGPGGGPDSPANTWFGLWVAVNAVNLSGNDGLGGQIYRDDFGQLQPAMLGHPEEPRSAWFDAAYTLLPWQDPETGAWGTGFNGAPEGYTPISSHAFALLTLMSIPFGLCDDRDEDGRCYLRDNCPFDANPDQSDRDGDEVGDVCDSCPDDPDRSQADLDEDGIGDVCDDWVCVPDGQPEICDGVDNDCDRLVDALPDGSPVIPPERCASGQPGQCAQGRTVCQDGGVRCMAERASGFDVCDLIDNDCDGVIDEGALNACRTCGEAPVERCDDRDNDCDGRTDEGDALCPDGLSCESGFCGPPCREGRCPRGLRCEDEVCIGPCAGVECPEGQICDPESAGCLDPCAEVMCPEGEVCQRGACVPDLSGPCRDVACEEGWYCQDGQCRRSCATVSCALDKVCLGGLCASALCGGRLCGEGELCLQGECQPDPCNPDVCGEGEACVLGVCAPDPCLSIRCPRFQRCVLTLGTPQCAADWLTHPDTGAGFGGFGGYGGEGGAGGGSGAGDVGDPDAEIPDVGAGGAQDSPPDMGLANPDAEDSGCACEVTEPQASDLLWPLALIGLLALRRRRSQEAVHPADPV